MMNLERPERVLLQLEVPADDVAIPDITLDFGEQEELQRQRLEAMTSHMLRGAVAALAEDRRALSEATTLIQAVNDQTTLGEAALVKERYRIARSKYLRV